MGEQVSGSLRACVEDQLLQRSALAPLCRAARVLQLLPMMHSARV